jgi:2-isopropylmalate synthase
LFDLFEREYGVESIPAPQHQVLEEAHGTGGKLVRLIADVEVAGRQFNVQGAGNGPIDAFVEALAAASGETIRVLDYHEHAIGSGANAQAVAYLELRIGERTLFGVGMDSNIVSASLKAIVSGLQRAQAGSRKEITWQTN